MTLTKRGMESLEKARLYGICDLTYLNEGEALPVSRKLLEGGAGVLQLRAKGRDPQDLTKLAIELRELCEAFAVPFVVNDHVQLARETGAHGLHLGQEDGSIAEARSTLGEEVIIGRSTHSLVQAEKALVEKADYIGFGPLFPTPTKEGRPAIGLGDIAAMEEKVGSRIPAFCIGGIKPDNLPEVLGAGAQRVVVVSHLLTHEQPSEASRQLISQLTSNL